MLGPIYKLHKWIGLGIGLVLGMWLVTGIVLSTVPERPPRVSRDKAPPLDLSRATVSPAQAAQAVGAGVEQIDLIRILDVPVYHISTASGGMLVDARDGSPFVVTDSVARAIAISQVGHADVGGVTKVVAPGAGPAYRVVFSDPSRTWVEVSREDGMARISDRRGRFRRTMGGLHSFRALDGLLPGRNTYSGLLVVAGLIALACVITGYVVVLPRRQRTRPTQES